MAILRHWFPLSMGLLALCFLPAVVLVAADLFGYPELNQRLEDRFGLSHRTAVPGWASIVLFLLPILLILLYFLRLKRKPIAVPSTFLWKKSIEDLHVNRLMQWLRHNILLLLQLAALLAAIYAVMAPRLHGKFSAGKHYIILIDNSASMSATDIAPDRLTWAKAEALKEIDAAGDNDSGMVIAFSSSAEIRQSYTTNRSLLRAAIDGIRPTQNTTNVSEALSLAESLANPLNSTENEATRPLDPEPGKERTYAAAEGLEAEVYLFSDGRFADLPDFALSNLKLTFRSPGNAETGTADNVGIVRFDAVRDELDATKVRVFARLLNFRDHPATVALDLDVSVRGQAVQDVRRRTAVVPPRIYRKPPADDPSAGALDSPGEFTVNFDLSDVQENVDLVLHLRMSSHKDAFALDDQAWLVLGVVRKARVMLVTTGNPLLEYFFAAPATLDVADVTVIAPRDLADPKKYGEPARDGEFDLIIFDRCGPGGEQDMPRANTLFVGHPPPPWHTEGAADDYKVEEVQFPRVSGWSDAHAIMRGLRGWHELEVADAFKFNNLPGKTPRLVEASGNHLLLFPLQRSPYTDLIMAFPLATDDARWNTRWFLRPLFPLFLRNVLYTLGNVRDAATEETILPGRPKILRPASAVQEIRIRLPDRSTRTLDRGTRADFVFGETGVLGVYAAEWEKESRRFAVNLFDAEESNIDPRPSIRIGNTDIEAGTERRQPRELWRWAVLLVLLLLCVEWYVYNRRVQV